MKFNDELPRELFNKNKNVIVEPAGMRKYNDWRRLIIRGENPVDAAKHVGDLHIEKLMNSDKCSIRLSQKHRAVFSIDKANNNVTIHSIGGHY